MPYQLPLTTGAQWFGTRKKRGLPLWIIGWLCLLLAVGRGAAQEAPGAVVVGDRVVLTLQATVGSREPADRAALVNQRIERVLSDPALHPEFIEVRVRPDGAPAIVLGELPLLTVSSADAVEAEEEAEELARRWARRLRRALIEAKPLHRTAEEKHVSFQPLLLVSVLAFLVPLIASRFRRFPLPVVVGEILVGILIGKSGLGLVTYDSWLQFLAEFGFAYLMFLSGLEVDFQLLAASWRSRDEPGRSWRQNPVLLSLLVFGLTLLTAGAISQALALAGMLKQPWMMTLVLSTTSLGMVVPTLKERGIIGTQFGQTLLVAALIADFATMFLITVVAGWLSQGPTLRLLLSLGIVVVFAAALRVGRLMTRSGGVQKLFDELAQASAQVHVRGSLALMLVFVALSEQLGTEVILGAFLAGVLLALFSRKEGSDLPHKLETLGFGFFIPIFFIMVGVRFDLQAVASSREGLLLASALVAGAFFIKMTASLPFRWIASWRETLAGGLLLSSRLSLIIAAAEIGVRLGLFTPAVQSAAVCVALVTCVVGPLGFQLLMPAPVRRSQRAVVVGSPEYERVLVPRIRTQGWEVEFIPAEDAEAAIKTANGAGFPQIFARLQGADVVVAASSSDALNQGVCEHALHAAVGRVLAVAWKGEAAERLRLLGVLPVTPALATLQTLEGMITHPAVFRILCAGTEAKRILEAELENESLVGQTLREIRWPGDVLVLSIQREGDLLVPDGTTLLRSGDRLTFIGSEDPARETLELLAHSC